jgi:pimeloyl-ACP methyl ester carboxylesterase
MQYLDNRGFAAPLRSLLARILFARPSRRLGRNALIAAALSITATVAAALTPTLFTSRFNDSTEVDTSVLGTRIPLVLVHGLGGSAEGWESFLRAYDRNPSWRSAFKPYSFQYSTSQSEVDADPNAPRTLTALGAALRDAMQGFYDKPAAAPDFGFGNKRVLVLAHSMGGLVARSMMQEYAFRDGQRGGQKVLHLITLGTPHHGTPLANAGISLGYQTIADLSGTYAGFLKDVTWTNYDGLNMAGRLCNDWLARLNNYAPSTGATYGNCGAIPASPLPGYYEKIIAYGASDLQDRDFPSGDIGVYKPGSDLSSYWFPHELLLNGLSRPYPNDGIVPFASAQFNGAALWQRAEAFACDHRYLKNGYPEFVRTATATYTDVAFCAATNNAAPYPSGTPDGFAVSGSIFGGPAGIIQTITTASEVERVFDWTEQAHAALLQPAGATTEISGGGFYYRYYPGTQAFLGVLGGNVYFLGAASNNLIVYLGTLADFLGAAQSSGF